jgi:hypothetical protein
MNKSNSNVSTPYITTRLARVVSLGIALYGLTLSVTSGKNFLLKRAGYGTRYDICKEAQETITSFAPGWIEEPRTGEKFPSVEEELRRLQAYAFFSGFALVTGSSTTDRKRFPCVKHGTKPKNTHNLEDVPVTKEVYEQNNGQGADGKRLRRRVGTFRGQGFLIQSTLFVLRFVVQVPEKLSGPWVCCSSSSSLLLKIQ